jgi:hypothetical protein
VIATPIGTNNTAIVAIAVVIAIGVRRQESASRGCQDDDADDLEDEGHPSILCK